MGHRHAIYINVLKCMLMYIACLCPNLVSVHFYAIPILHFKFPKFFIYLYLQLAAGVCPYIHSTTVLCDTIAYILQENKLTLTCELTLTVLAESSEDDVGLLLIIVGGTIFGRYSLLSLHTLQHSDSIT